MVNDTSQKAPRVGRSSEIAPHRIGQCVQNRMVGPCVGKDVVQQSPGPCPPSHGNIAEVLHYRPPNSPSAGVAALPARAALHSARHPTPRRRPRLRPLKTCSGSAAKRKPAGRGRFHSRRRPRPPAPRRAGAAAQRSPWASRRRNSASICRALRCWGSASTARANAATARSCSPANRYALPKL